MSKVTSIGKARERKERAAAQVIQHEGFQPCSPDMTICGDCADNRAKKKCPRLAEWLSVRKER
jgi:hypothetical protein